MVLILHEQLLIFIITTMDDDEFEDDDATTDFRRLEKYCEMADVHFTRNSFPGLMRGIKRADLRWIFCSFTN